MSWLSAPEPKRSYCFLCKADAQTFAGKLGKGGRARINGAASVRKTPLTRVNGRLVYRADSRYDDSFTVHVKPFSFADVADMAALAAECGGVPAPFAHF